MEFIRKLIFVSMLSLWGYYAFSLSDLTSAADQVQVEYSERLEA